MIEAAKARESERGREAGVMSRRSLWCASEGYTDARQPPLLLLFLCSSANFPRMFRRETHSRLPFRSVSLSSLFLSLSLSSLAARHV